MAELSVQLTASITQLERQLKKAKSLLNDTGEAGENAAKKVSSVGDKGAKQITNLGKSSANAVPSLQEFSRVIQDAPFGIQGVANNITQLTSQFGNLSKSAGGTGAALRAMLTSLAGPAGILLAVSALTSLFVSLSQSGTKLSDVLSFLAGDSNDLAKAKRNLAEATKEGVANAKSEIATLNILLSVARDENKSRESRQRAINKINQEYKDLLPNLNLENVRTQEVTKAVDELSKSLIREAKIRGAQNLIAKETEKILEAQAKDAIDSANAWDILTAALANTGSAAGIANNGIDLSLKGLKRQQETITESEKRIAGLTKRLSELIEEDIDLAGGFSSTKLDLNKLLKVDNPTPIFTSDQLDRIFGIDDKSISRVSVQAQKLNDAVNLSLEKASSPIKAYTSRIENVLTEFNANANNIIQNGIVNTFASIGQAIGTSLAQGENILSSLGKSLLASLGSVLVQLGTLAIETGVGILAVQTALKSLNPYVAIAAGAALVALGSTFSSSTRNLGGAGSGSVAGQGSGGSFSSGSGSFSNTGGFGGGKVVFEISGTSLYGVLRNTRESNSRLGGNIGL